MSKAKLNPTSFRKGRAKTGGRKPGSSNMLTREIRECIWQAASECGSDGKGKEGAVGFFKYMAKQNLAAFAMLLARILPTQVNAEINGQPRHLPSREDILTELRQLGLPIERIFEKGVMLELKPERGSGDDTQDNQ
jgi:hypothetical protein